jgi:hypothetical protein
MDINEIIKELKMIENQKGSAAVRKIAESKGFKQAWIDANFPQKWDANFCRSEYFANEMLARKGYQS